MLYFLFVHYREKTDCDQFKPKMDFGNQELLRRPFENTKGHGSNQDSNELSFRVPSIPSSPSLAASTPDSTRQRGHETNGKS